MKKCTRCGKIKNLDSFVKDKRCPDGTNNICKECFNAYRVKKRKVDDNYATAYKDSNNKHYHNKIKSNEVKMTVRRTYGSKYCKDNKLKRINDRMKLRCAGSLSDLDLKVIKAMFPVCAYCGKPLGKYHLDHIVPIKLKGTTKLGNIARVCSSCNLSKGAKDFDTWYIEQKFFNTSRYLVIKQYQSLYK